MSDPKEENSYLKKWEKNKKLELFLISLMALFFLVGFAADVAILCFGYSGFPVIPVKDFGIICNTLLGVQGTVITFTVAMLALISPRISGSYMGVSKAKFYMDIQPMLFRQKYIFITLIVLLVFSIFARVLNFNNILIFTMLSSFYMIIISFLNVYRVFVEDYDHKKDIKGYLKNYIEKIDIEESKNIKYFWTYLDNFINEWIREIEKQYPAEYKEFRLMFEKIFKILIKDLNNNVCIRLKEYCGKLCNHFLENNSNEIKIKGITLLDDIYLMVFSEIKRIYNEKNNNKKIFFEFYLFLEAFPELVTSIDYLDRRDVEKFDWSNFIMNVIYSNLFIESFKNDKELNDLNLFCRKLGVWASENMSENNFTWKKIIENYYIFSAILRNEILEKWHRKICFNYSISLIINEKPDFIDDILNSNFVLGSYYTKRYENFLIYTLQIKCFFYYIGKREKNSKFISEKLKEKVNKVLEKPKAIEFFKKLLFALFSEYKSILNYDLNKIIGKDLLVEEENMLYSLKNDKIIHKEMIMNSTVQDFLIFSILYLESEYHYLNHIFNDYLNTCTHDKYNIIRNYSYDYIKKDKKDILILINGYLEMLFSDREVILNKSEEMYNILYKTLKDKLKELLPDEINEINILKNESWVLDNIEGFRFKIHKYFENKYENIIYLQSDAFGGHLSKLKEEFTVKYFYTINFSKKFDIFNLFKFDWLESRFVQLLGKILYGNKYLKLYKTTEFLKHFKNESNLKDFIEADLLGSLHPFRPSKSEQIPEFLEWEKISEVLQIHPIYHDVYYAILLRKGALKIYLEEPIVEVRSQKIEDHKIVPDPETGLYRYEVEGGIPLDFTKEELEPYLEKTGRVLEVKIKFFCEVEGESPIGYIIQR